MKAILYYWVAGLFLLVGSHSIYAASPPYIFDWLLTDTDYLSIPAVPMPGMYSLANDEMYDVLYDEQAAKGYNVGVMLNDPTSPYDGSKDPLTLMTVMGYAPRLDFVFGDFENSSRNPSITAMVSQVRSYASSAINTAYIGNYHNFAGTPNNAMHWPDQIDRSAEDTFYRNSGLTVSMPSCYPYAYHEVHTWGWLWGTNICPNKRSALFWSPLELFSLAKRNLPAGHLLIPWTARMILWQGYTAPTPTREDVKAMIRHMRLRGADGYYRFLGVYGDANPVIDRVGEEENRMDMLDAWHSLDGFFSGSGTPVIMNLDTNKTGGIEWSGMYKNGRIKIIISNLHATTAKSVNWTPVAESNMPALSPIVEPNTHIELDYTYGTGVVLAPRTNTCPKILSLVVPPSDYICVNATPSIVRERNFLRTNYYYGDCVSYLKYNLSGLALPPAGQQLVIASAVVRTDSTCTGDLYRDSLFAVTKDSWTGSTMTWQNKPAVSTVLCSSAYPSGYRAMRFSSSALTSFVEQQVNGDKVASIQLTDNNAAGTKGHAYYADDAPSLLPSLWIDYYYQTPGLCNDDGDYNRDGKVGLDDFAFFAGEWLWGGRTGGCNECDLNCDGSVNSPDINTFAEQWLAGTL